MHGNEPRQHRDHKYYYARRHSSMVPVVLDNLALATGMDELKAMSFNFWYNAYNLHPKVCILVPIQTTVFLLEGITV